MKDTKLRQLFVKIAKKSFHGENVRVKKNIHTNNKHYPAFCPKRAIGHNDGVPPYNKMRVMC